MLIVDFRRIALAQGLLAAGLKPPHGAAQAAIMAPGAGVPPASLRERDGGEGREDAAGPDFPAPALPAMR